MPGKKFIITQAIKNISSTPFDCILHLDVIEMWQLMGVGSQNNFQIYMSHYMAFKERKRKTSGHST